MRGLFAKAHMKRHQQILERSKRMERWKRVVAVAVFGIAAVQTVGCRPAKKPENKGKKPMRVEVVAAERGRLVEFLETTGDVMAVNTVMLQATVEGPIAFCPWREGDHVEKAGQKLIEINRPLYRQEVAAAEATLAVVKAKLADLKAGVRPEEIAQAKQTVLQLEDCTNFAKADLGRIGTLVKSGSLSAESVEKARVSYVKCQTQLRSANKQVAMLEAGPTATEVAVQKAAVDEAATKVALARAKLDECLLRAPFAGVITQVLVRPGDLATPRASLLKMMDTSSLIVRAGLPETCAANIRKGTEATVRLDTYPGKTFRATIERVHPRLEWDSRTRFIEARVIDPVELIPRMFARLSVQGRVAEDAVTVPAAAIVTTPRGQKVVFVVSENKASTRQVTVGLEQGGRVQIIEGVQAGEKVVVAGNLNLKNGAAVKLAPPAKDAAAGSAAGGKGE
jgi:HlyD family secretion protein